MRGLIRHWAGGRLLVLALALLGLLLAIELRAQPTNDHFTNRVVLTGTNLVVTAQASGSTVEPKEPNANYALQWNDTWLRATVWYEWTAPTNGRVDLYLSADDPSWRVVCAYRGNTLRGLQQVTRPDSGIWFTAKAGETFAVQVFSPGACRVHVEFRPPPANDQFQARLPLTGAVVNATGSNRAATRERGEPRHNENRLGRSVWWSWVAPATGWAFLDVASPQFNASMQVYTGTTLTRLKDVPGFLLNDAPPKGVFYAQAGVEYQIAIDGPVREDGYVLNGDFELQLALTGLTLLSPTNQTIMAAPPALHLSAANLLPNIDGSVASVTFVARDLLTEQELQLGSAAGPAYQRSWINPPPGYYAIQARTTNQHGRAIDSNPAAIALRPANDEFANRIQLTGYAATLEVNMAAATRVRSDPKVSRFLGDDLRDGGVEGSTLWWSWTAPASGTVSLNGNNVFVGVAAYQGARPGALTPVLKPSRGSGQFEAKAGVTYHILASDRSPAYAPNQATIQLTLNSLRLALPAEPASFRAPAQIPVTVLTTESSNAVTQVELWAGTNRIGTASGPPFLFRWDNVPPGMFSLTARAKRTTGEALQSVPVDVIVRPSNDDAVNATELTGSNIVASVYNATASREPEDPASLQYNYSVWYKWKAPASGVLTLNSDRSDFKNPLLWFIDLYAGTSRTNWAWVAPTRVGDFDRIHTYRVVGGTTYHITMGVGYPTEFHLLLGFAAAPVNDNFEDAITLVGTHVQTVGSTLRATVQPGEPEHFPGSLHPSSWYLWTAPGDGNASLQIGEGFFGYPTFAIYTGNALTNLVGVSATGSFVEGLKTFQARSNVTYRLALLVLNGENGAIPFTLNFQGSAAAAPLARLHLPMPVPSTAQDPPELPDDWGLTIALALPASSGSAPSQAVHLHLRARSTTECVLETSDDLANWTPLATLSVSDTPLEYVDKPATNVDARFYRLVKRREAP